EDRRDAQPVPLLLDTEILFRGEHRFLRECDLLLRELERAQDAFQVRENLTPGVRRRRARDVHLDRGARYRFFTLETVEDGVAQAQAKAPARASAGQRRVLVEPIVPARRRDRWEVLGSRRLQR